VCTRARCGDHKRNKEVVACCRTCEDSAVAHSQPIAVGLDRGGRSAVLALDKGKRVFVVGCEGRHVLAALAQQPLLQAPLIFARAQVAHHHHLVPDVLLHGRSGERAMSLMLQLRGRTQLNRTARGGLQ
jgi:hypothetical protein